MEAAYAVRAMSGLSLWVCLLSERDGEPPNPYAKAQRVER